MDAKQKLLALILASPSLADDASTPHTYLASLRAQREELIAKILAAKGQAPHGQQRQELAHKTKNIQNRTRGRLGELLGRIVLTQNTAATDKDLHTDKISFDTPLGKRRIDLYWPEQKLALETKMGYITLSRHIRQQIQKDAFLLANGSVDTVIWLLIKDGSRSVKLYLAQHGITCKVGWPEAHLPASAAHGQSHPCDLSRSRMNQELDPSRRRLLLASGSVLLLSNTACASRSDRQLSFATFAAAQAELAVLLQAKNLSNSATWNLAQTIVHCAQSIEFSMTGFPQPKSALFQRTLGAAAFSVFAWRGRMSHDLAEPIPGAAVLNPQVEQAQALEKLHSAIQKFQQHSGPLKPHFAYGELSKQEYELAHAMHLANHFSAFQVLG